MGRLMLIVILVAGSLISGCGRHRNQSAQHSAGMTSFGENSNSNQLLGAGSGSASPLVKLFAAYGAQTPIMVSYQGIGSAAAVLKLTGKSVDFIVTDTLLNDSQIQKMPFPVLEVPLFGNAPGAGNGKPAAFALIFKEQDYDGRSLQRAQKLLKSLWWDVHEGQKYCKAPGYSPLPPGDVASAEQLLRSATFSGKPILP